MKKDFFVQLTVILSYLLLNFFLVCPNWLPVFSNHFSNHFDIGNIKHSVDLDSNPHPLERKAGTLPIEPSFSGNFFSAMKASTHLMLIVYFVNGLNAEEKWSYHGKTKKIKLNFEIKFHFVYTIEIKMLDLNLKKKLFFRL